jgi:hypothetical protein
MADPYIDQYETLAYGRFSAGQILALVVGLDPDLDPFVKIVAARLSAETDEMEKILGKADALDNVTYKPAEGAPDLVTQSRALLRRLVRYAESRPNGDSIASDILHGETLTTVLRRRPVKLAGALDHAASMITKHAASLPEHATWKADIAAAHDGLVALNEGVRAARTNRRQTTPEVDAARSAWLRRYSATKSIIEGILKPLGKLAMMPEIFDDLAETHRAPGVSDEPAPEAPATP